MPADGSIGLRATRPARLTPHAIFHDALSSGSLGPEMIVLPAGRFEMGAPEKDPLSYASERPTRIVTIEQPFALNRFQTTFEDYAVFCRATGAEEPDDQGWGRGRRPVINVSWEDAVAYCEWLSAETGSVYRLPSEAEWEFACKAGASSRYATGATISSLDANFNGSEPADGAPPGPFLERTIEVGSYDANAWGFYDMHGNVCEWCADCWFDDYANAPFHPAPRRCENSLGVSAVVRGGGWSAWPRYVRSTDRWHYSRDDRFEMVGFRVAREL